MKESETGLMCDNDDDSDNSPDELIKITEEPKDKWDCESILSEYFDCRRLGGVIKKNVQSVLLQSYNCCCCCCSKITNYEETCLVGKSLQIFRFFCGFLTQHQGVVLNLR